MQWINLRKKLSTSLCGAFSEADLERMLRYECEKRLNAIVPRDANLVQMVEAILDDAERQGWIEQLVSGAKNFNASNAPLNDVIEQIEAQIAIEGKLFYQAMAQDVIVLPDDSSWETHLQAYYASLYREVGFVHVLGRQGQQSLEGIFTDVNILDRITAERRYAREHLTELFSETSRRWRYGERTERHEGIYALQNFNKLFILGKPGSGKTTFLKWSALQAIQGSIQKVPIFVRLHEMASVVPDLRTRSEVLDYIVEHAVFRIPDARAFLRRLLVQGRALVLFDGLDEVNEAGDQRRNLIHALKGFVSQYDRSQCLITCRVAATDYSFPQFEYVEMADFNDEQIGKFVGNWFAHDEIKQTQCREQLIGNGQAKTLRELAQIPLLLTLLCLVYEERGEFPPERSEIYADAINALLSKWDAKRNIRRDSVYQKLTPRRKSQLLAHVAAKVFADGEILLPEKAWIGQIEAYAATIPGVDEPDGTLILREIAARHGLIVERAKGYYSFSHLTLQEYFTARWIVENEARGSLKLLMAHVGEDRWKEVFLLVAQLLEDGDIFATQFYLALREIVIGDEKLINLLTWADVKRRDVATSYQEAAVRSLYLNLDLDLDLDLDLYLDRNLYRNLYLDLYRNLYRNLYLDRNLDLYLYLYLDRNLDLDLYLDLDLDLYLYLDLYLDLYLYLYRNLDLRRVERIIEYTKKLNMYSLCEKMQQLRNQFPSKNIIRSEIKNWLERLRTVMIEERNIGHRRNLTKESVRLLNRYIAGNLVLVECLSLARLSPARRQEIKDALLLVDKEL